MVIVSSTFSAPTGAILGQSPSTKLFVNDKELGTATLYITQSNVLWGGGVAAIGGPSPAITLWYHSICLHALQSDPTPALYMVVNFEMKLPEYLPETGDGDKNEDDDDDEFDGDDHLMTQLRFVPQNQAILPELYSAMTQGQLLNPDSADEVDEGPYVDGEEFEEGDDEFEDAEESDDGPEEAAARLNSMRLENSNGVHYEDCEDSDEGEE